MSQSVHYPRYLADFYYRGTLILQCIKQSATIRNWVTFCGYNKNKQQMLIILQIGFQPIVYDNMYHFIIAVGLVILNFSKKYGM